MSVGEVEPMMKRRSSHLKHVESIPDDAVAVTEYGPHSFDNLYYSPSTAALYQQYAKRVRFIETGNDEHGKKKKIYVRTKDKQTIYVSMKKLLKQLEALIDTAVESPIEMPKKTRGRKKVQAQVGEITNAKEALAKAKTTKQRGRKITVEPEDIVL